jgi:type II secretory pathway pseudopilin PulG
MRKIRTFTLIEMIISLALFVALLGGTMSMVSNGYLSLRKSRTFIVANNIVMALLEQHSTWDDLKELDAPPATPWSPPHSGPDNGTYTPANQTLNDMTFSSSITMADGPVGASADLKKLSVTVSWDGGARSITFETLKAYF